MMLPTTYLGYHWDNWCIESIFILNKNDLWAQKHFILIFNMAFDWNAVKMSYLDAIWTLLTRSI